MLTFWTPWTLLQLGPQSSESYTVWTKHVVNKPALPPYLLIHRKSPGLEMLGFLLSPPFPLFSVPGDLPVRMTSTGTHALCFQLGMSIGNWADQREVGGWGQRAYSLALSLGGQLWLAVSLLRRSMLLSRWSALLLPLDSDNCFLPCPFGPSPRVAGQENLSGMPREEVLLYSPAWLPCTLPIPL